MNGTLIHHKLGSFLYKSGVVQLLVTQDVPYIRVYAGLTLAPVNTHVPTP